MCRVGAGWRTRQTRSAACDAWFRAIRSETHVAKPVELFGVPEEVRLAIVTGQSDMTLGLGGFGLPQQINDRRRSL